MQGKRELTMHDRCIEENYQFVQVSGAQGNVFEDLLEQTYQALAFPLEKIRADPQADRFVSFCGDELASICALQEADRSSELHALVQQEIGCGPEARFLELKNVIVAAPSRGSIALGIMLYECAKRAHALGYRALIGLTRFQTLRHFVDYGVSPIDHTPLHVLGRSALLDFAVYFDTQDPASVAYMHERSRRYFHQIRVMTGIRSQRVRTPSRTAQAGVGHEQIAIASAG